ncbi:MAG: molybdopterin-synthase adenylyltransferase MoeB [Acidobacteriota bacterium]
MSPTQPDDLSSDEMRRYGRHLVMPQVGLEGQRRLRQAKVLLVGTGGLGSPAALYLAAAGVGTLGLVDFDRVDESNLQRQVLFATDDVGESKVTSAAARLRALNPHVEIELHDVRLDASNVLELVGAYDIVVDGSDNFQTRYLVNDACVMTGTPDVWGAVLHFEGQLSVFGVRGGPCYRCLFPEPPPPGLVPSCAEAGVLGVLPGTIGTLQATEAIKLILGRGEPLVGRFVTFDALSMRLREINLPKNPECLTCSEGAEPQLVDLGASCEDNLPMTDENSEVPLNIDVHQLHAWREQERDLVLLDVREEQEYELCRIDGSVLIPMRELPGKLAELDSAALTVVHCHHGPRSSHAVHYLRSQGFDRATNLAGGIDAWSLHIDPAVPRY